MTIGASSIAGGDQRRLRAGIVGGGRGAFIGAIHRIAAELDGQATVVAGAMSSDSKIARASAADWHLDRSYDSFQEMARTEVQREDGIDFAIIATPTHLHAAIAKAFIEAGIHVICDKPLAFSSAEAGGLVELVRDGRTLLALTHNYTGYPLVREARALVRAGRVGEIRKVLVEYQQDWLMTPLERTGHKQAAWRTDPARAGPSCCVGDIGTHAENLLEYITGLRVTSLCADLTSFVEGRVLDDDANILLRLERGAKGTLVCSQVACGEENDLRIRIYGTRAGLEWRQQEPNTLILKPAGEPWRSLRAGQDYLSDDAKAVARTPPGHPEGYLESFASIYRLFIEDIRRLARGEPPQGGYPSARDGLRGLQFVEAAVDSARRGAQWVELPRTDRS
jgi:predicted dehydrogenase